MPRCTCGPVRVVAAAGAGRLALDGVCGADGAVVSTPRDAASALS